MLLSLTWNVSNTSWNDKLQFALLQWWLRYGTTVTRQENLIQTSFVSRMNMFPGIAIHTVTLYTFFLDFFKYSNYSSLSPSPSSPSLQPRCCTPLSLVATPPSSHFFSSLKVILVFRYLFFWLITDPTETRFRTEITLCKVNLYVLIDYETSSVMC